MALHDNDQAIFRLADQFLAPYRIKHKADGREIVPSLCPFCQGGDHSDQGTFALNVEKGCFVCKRGSCGVQGSVEELAKHFGFSERDLRGNGKPMKMPKVQRYDLPKVEMTQPTDAIFAYFEKRKICKETVEAFKVGADKNGMIVFPFYENGTNVFVKFRRPYKPNPDEAKKSKEWREPNTKAVLFHMDDCVFSQPLYITEGEIDAMSLYEAGITNVVSVPSGCDDLSWIENCFDWLEKFQTIVLFGDNDTPGQKMVHEVAKRLDESRCMIVSDYPDRPDGTPCKDANEILYYCGAFELADVANSAEAIPLKGIIDLADVEPIDETTIPRIKTMIPQLDESIGGLAPGSTTVFTGKAGDGKLLADDTPVFTRSGWKNHGDLVVGDKVVGLDGRFKKVTYVFPKNVADLCVTFSNGEKIQCHHNHEWVIEYHSGNSHKQKIVTAGEMYQAFQSGKGYLKNKHGEKNYCFKLPIRTAVDTEDSVLAVAPYTLGAWLGGGRNNNPDLCTGAGDEAIIDRIAEDGYTLSWRTTHSKTGCLYTGYKTLRKGLQSFGMCYSQKRMEKHIPCQYLTASLDQRLQLLAGLLDMDGYYDKNKNTYTYATVEESLCRSFMDLISTFGWDYYHHTSSFGAKGRKPCHYISFAPRMMIPCVLERKQMQKIRQPQRISIVDISPCSPVQGNCISVEGGIYCAGRTMLPTHNSTLTGQLLLNAIEQGKSVCAYSGELRKEKFQAWINLQAAGSEWITLKYDKIRGKQVPYVPWDVQQRIIDWYRGKFFLFDNNEIFESNQANSIIEVFTMAHRRYGCELFLVDNMMTSLSDAQEETRAQGQFINALKKFATRYNVHVLIVAHPRKTKQGEKLQKDDVGGNSQIVNLADTAIVVERPNLRIIKNREGGRLRTIECCYCTDSHRIYQADTGDISHYSWDQSGLTPPETRANSLPEYGIQMAENPMPF